MNLLLAIDDSEGAEAAVREVASRPWPQDTQIRVLSVASRSHGVAVPQMPAASGPVSIPAGAEWPPGYPELQPALDEISRKTAQHGVDALAQRGIEAGLRVRAGTPGPEIATEAREWPADLVVMGSRGHGALKRILLGSVAEYVLRNAPCSVEVVKDRQQDATGPT